MSTTNQQGHFFFIVLVFALFNFDTYGLRVPETRFILLGDLERGCAVGGVTELATGGLTPKGVARLSDDQRREHIVEHDMRLESERKDLMASKKLLEEHQDQTYKLALESHAHTFSAKAMQKEENLHINQSDLTGNQVDMGSERMKVDLIEETAKKDEEVDKAYKELKQARATFAKARLKFEAAAKNLRNLERDPPPLTKELSQLDDEEYIIEAAKHDVGTEYSLKLWRKSKEWLHAAVANAYSRTLPGVWSLRRLSPERMEKLILEQAGILEMLAREGGSSIDSMTALTHARMNFLRPLLNQVGETYMPVLEQDALIDVLRCRDAEKESKIAALIMADRYWMSSGEISPEGKRYKGLTLYSAYDRIMEKLKPTVGNWFKMLHGWWNQNHTPNEMKSTAIVPDKGPQLK